MLLRACYALSGTDRAYAATHALPGTALAHPAICLRTHCTAPGTDARLRHLCCPPMVHGVPMPYRPWY
eukprot:299750-Rhodomonas_salina.4